MRSLLLFEAPCCHALLLRGVSAESLHVLIVLLKGVGTQNQLKVAAVVGRKVGLGVFEGSQRGTRVHPVRSGKDLAQVVLLR